MKRSLVETEKISVKEGIAAAKELMKKFKNDKKILKIEIVDPMKGRQN
jgi:hypothetical protein